MLTARYAAYSTRHTAPCTRPAFLYSRIDAIAKAVMTRHAPMSSPALCADTGSACPETIEHTGRMSDRKT